MSPHKEHAGKLDSLTSGSRLYRVRVLP